MMVTAHALAGAAIGMAGAACASRPNLLRYVALLALPVAFASHFVLDAVPHLDSHGLFGAPGGLTRPEIAMAALDTLAAIAIVAWLAWRSPWPVWISIGAFLGVAPDIENLPVIKEWLGGGVLAPAIAWHHGIQRNVPPAAWLLGFGTQAVVLMLALWVITRAQKRGGASGRMSRPETSLSSGSRRGPARGS